MAQYFQGITTREGVLERLEDIAESGDPRARRTRAAVLLLQVTDNIYHETSQRAVALGLLDDTALRRVEVIRAQELPNVEWRYRAFAILERGLGAENIEPVVEDGDEDVGTVYAEGAQLSS